MKVALVYGKGLDGCGVQRGGVEMQRWAARTGKAQVDIYSLTERTFVRAAGHQMAAPPITFKPEDIPAIADRLEGYDMVILQSLPSHKHEHSTSISFYRNLVCRLRNPVLVGMMHEIKQMNIDCYPLIIPILNRCDVVFNFSEGTWFSRRLAGILPSKRLGERTRRFRLWSDIEDLVRFRRTHPIADRARRLTYVGRWTTMKDPRRLLDMYPHFQAADPSFQLILHGIEKSIGAKYDVIVHENARYVSPTSKAGDGWWDEPRVPVFGPYKREDGLARMAESMFACSFYQLPAEPHNYGDRMEYTQIEIIGVGCVPLFDRHFGENNRDSSGRRFIDVPDLAVWSSREDMPGTVDEVMDLAGDAPSRRRMADAGLQFIAQEFMDNRVLPEMLGTIMDLGKDRDKFTDEGDMLEAVIGSRLALGPYTKLMDDGTAPAVGFKQAETKRLCYLQGKGRVTLEEYGGKRAPAQEPAGGDDLLSFFG